MMLFWILILTILAPAIISILALIFFLRKHRFLSSLLFAFGIGLLATLVLYGITGFVYYTDLKGLIIEFEMKDTLVIIEEKDSVIASFPLASDQESSNEQRNTAATELSAVVKELLEQKRYDQLSTNNILLVVDLSLYDTVPEEISIQGTKIDKQKILALLKGEKRDGIFDEENKEKNIPGSSNETAETGAPKELLAFMILTSELVKHEGASALINGFKDGDLRLVTEHQITIATIQSAPKIVLDLGNEMLDDALSQIFAEQQDQEGREQRRSSPAS